MDAWNLFLSAAKAESGAGGCCYMQIVFLISFSGSIISLEESKLATISAQIFHDNSSAIHSSAADFPTPQPAQNCPFPFCGGFQQLLPPSNLWGSGAECLPAFSIWEPGLGEEVLVLPALKPSLKVGSTMVSENLNLSLASSWRTEVVVSLL